MENIQKLELKELSQIQSQLFTVEQLLGSQHSKQEQLTNEMLSHSNDVICELRLLYLVRSTILSIESEDISKIFKSQTLQGLSFSALEYCPSFFDSNLLNHYMTFISFLRLNPSILAKLFFNFSILKPNLINYLAYSVFLTLFQQGWCVEEDNLLFETLKYFSINQFQKNNISNSFKSISLNNTLNSPQVILNSLEPFSTFLTAYLFNCSSFSYLQCALSQIVQILHSSSSLRDKHNVFIKNSQNQKIATFGYWEVICEHALICFNSLINCFELLPLGVSLLFKFIRENFEDGENHCILLFFESFVNRALDNPSILGLVPWHPGSSEWSPSKDISSVFRSKYNHLLKSSFYHPLRDILDTIQSFQEFDFIIFFDKLTNNNLKPNLLISEKELLNTNPNFPKELIITGRDLCLLHEAAVLIPENNFIEDNKLLEQFQRTTNRLGNIPQMNELALEHFRIVLQRPKEITAAAKLLRTKSLFSTNLSNNSKFSLKDPFAEYFCDIISTLPSFHEFINYLHPKSLQEFLEQMRILSPHFLPEKSLLQTDVVLFYSLSNKDEVSNLIPRLLSVTDERHTRAMEAADKTSSLRTQHQRVSNALDIVKTMRENVQSYLLFNLSIVLVRNDLNYQFQLTMSKSYNFINNINIFNEETIRLIDFTINKTLEYGLSHNHSIQISRILFFKVTDHITFQRFLLSDLNIWKKSTIISKIIEINRNEIIQQLLEGWIEEFNLRKKYLSRASELLGHIKSNSGVSVILYYCIEVVSLVTLMTKQCKNLKFDPCILWILTFTNTRHIYGIHKFISHFLLGNNAIDNLLNSKEIQNLGVFSSSVCMLLRLCEKYDKRIDKTWD